MTPRYFAYSGEGDDERHEVSDVAKMVAFMQEKQNGELSVDRYASIKIKFDINTGEVNPVSTEKRVWITYVFSTEAFQSIITPVKEAISLLAKIDMLQQLEKCDPDIKRIVQQRHVDTNGELANVTLPAVEETLRQIVRLVAPVNDPTFTLISIFSKPTPSQEKSSIYGAIYHALGEGKLYAISSLRDVETALQGVKRFESASGTDFKVKSQPK